MPGNPRGSFRIGQNSLEEQTHWWKKLQSKLELRGKGPLQDLRNNAQIKMMGILNNYMVEGASIDSQVSKETLPSVGSAKKTNLSPPEKKKKKDPAVVWIRSLKLRLKKEKLSGGGRNPTPKGGTREKSMHFKGEPVRGLEFH